ncbi:MAG TPA: hypothetical protein VIM55_01340 [Mucilaginibacter sp.]
MDCQQDWIGGNETIIDTKQLIQKLQYFIDFVSDLAAKADLISNPLTDGL